MIGKLLGGGLGFFLGGPLGALLGVAFGHAIDKENTPYVSPEYSSTTITQTHTQQAAFITILIALCAKMAQVDGKIDAGEVRIVKNFFREKMNADEQTLLHIKQIFKEALNKDYNLETLLAQWKTLANPQLNYALLDLLYQIAMADGTMHSNEENFINQVVMIIGIPDTVQKQIRGMYISSANQYYDILGVSPNADLNEIKKAYRNLVTQYHPDKLVSKGLPEDMIKFAQEKMNKINEAYDELKKIKKF